VLSSVIGAFLKSARTFSRRSRKSCISFVEFLLNCSNVFDILFFSQIQFARRLPDSSWAAAKGIRAVRPERFVNRLSGTEADTDGLRRIPNGRRSTRIAVDAIRS
jgi:hypothetical protein